MNIALIYKLRNQEAWRLARSLDDFLTQRGHRCFYETTCQATGIPLLPPDELIETCDMVVVMGGDGTFLHGASLMRHKTLPILGVNMGSLGFLTPFTSQNAKEAALNAIEGKYPITTRFRFLVEHLREGAVQHQFLAANDAVINSIDLARLLQIDCWEGTHFLSSYKADGLILATPMGSTAYSLAAGGPIMVPGLDAFALVPICPHHLTQRPLLLCSSAEVTIRLGHRAYLTIDGQRGCSVEPVDTLRLTKASLPIRVFTPKEHSFYNVLRHKLSWGAREVSDA